MSDEQHVLAHTELKERTERIRKIWLESDGEATGRERRKLRDEVRKWTPLAIATLVDCCMSGDSSSARIAAAQALLDRGYGKANVPDGPASVQVSVHLDAMRGQVRELLADPVARQALRTTLRETPAVESGEDER